MSDDQKTALEIQREEMEAAAEKENATRQGVGTRVKVGATRGKSTQNIKYEAFDESQPDTLPKSLQEFCNTVGLKLDPAGSQLIPLLITGYNDQQYTEASDPIKEYVDKSWSEAFQIGFRNAVRAIAKDQTLPIADVVMMVKPGFDAAHAKAKKSAA